MHNIDHDEIAKFNAIAQQWWNTTGEFKALHAINPLRLQFINQHVSLTGKQVLDIGCGGGILAESLGQQGAQVTGIDMAEGPLNVAKLHQQQLNLAVCYEQSTAEAYAEKHPHQFDVITCMEMLEHVPDPGSIIQSCIRLLKPEGHLFLSTLNRNLKSYAFAILGAEYALKLLPRGTHHYEKFIRPAELAAWLRQHHFDIHALAGIRYNLFTQQYHLCHDTSVNYLIYSRPAA